SRTAVEIDTVTEIESEKRSSQKERAEKERGVYTASLTGQCLAEFVGTFIVILVGDGAVAAAVMTNQLDGWGVAMMWGLAVTFGIYVAGPVSGAHFNPAVTITMAVFRDFPKARIVPFIASQIAGAFTGAAAVYGMWHGYWGHALEKLGIQVGGPGSQKLMMIFSCFYPNPGGIGVDTSALSAVST